MPWRRGSIYFIHVIKTSESPSLLPTAKILVDVELTREPAESFDFERAECFDTRPPWLGALEWYPVGAKRLTSFRWLSRPPLTRDVAELGPRNFITLSEMSKDMCEVSKPLIAVSKPFRVSRLEIETGVGMYRQALGDPAYL